MDHPTLWGHLFIFATTVVGFLFQWLREGRRHRWQQEQFRALTKEVQNGNGHA